MNPALTDVKKKERIEPKGSNRVPYLIKHKGLNPVLPLRPIITYNLIRHLTLLQNVIVRL